MCLTRRRRESVGGWRGADGIFDARFTRVITIGGGSSSSRLHLLQDMHFMRGERQTRFAFGTAGVFWTMDFGVEWFPCGEFDRPAGPAGIWFLDPLSDQIGSRASTSIARGAAFCGSAAYRGRRRSNQGSRWT